MKTRMAIPAALVVLLTGCVTINGPRDPLAHYQAEAKIASYLTAALYLDNHPEDRPIFEAVREGISGYLDAEIFDPVLLASYLRKNLPVKELKSERAGIFLTAGLMIFQDATGTITIETPPIVKAFMLGIREGLDLALANQPTC